MAIILTCRKCGRPFRAREEHAGIEVGCPRCQSPMVVPGPGGSSGSARSDRAARAKRFGRIWKTALASLGVILLVSGGLTGYLVQQGRVSIRLQKNAPFLTFRVNPKLPASAPGVDRPGFDPADLARTENWLSQRLTQLDELRRHQNELRLREGARQLEDEVRPWVGKRLTWDLAVNRVDEHNVYLESTLGKLRVMTEAPEGAPTTAIAPMVALPIGTAISQREAQALTRHDRIRVTAELSKLQIDRKATAVDDPGPHSRAVVILANPRTARQAALDDLMRAADQALRARRYDQAVQSFEAALPLVEGDDPDAPESRRVRGALAAAVAARARFQTFQGYVEAGRKALEAKYYDTAEREFREALDLLPDDPETRRLIQDAKILGLLEKARLAVQNVDFDDAHGHVKGALAIDPKDPRAQEARVNVRDAQYAAGIKEGQAAVKASEFATAVERFRQAQKARPTDRTAADLVQEAVALRDEARYRDGLRVAETAIAQFRYADAQIAALDALEARPGDAQVKSLAAELKVSVESGELARYKAGGRVLALAFESDGKTLLWVSDDGTISRCSVGTPGSASLQKGPPGQRLAAAAFSSDRRSVAVGDHGGELRHYHIAPDSNAAEPRTQKGEEGGIRCVAFSANGTFLATGHERWAVQIWDAEHNASNGRISTYPGRRAVTSVAFAPDGQTIITGHETGSVVQWAMLAPHRRIAEAGAPKQAHSAEVPSLGFSPDGRTLATASHDGTIKLWNTKELDLLATFRLPGSASFVVFSTTGKALAAGGEDGSIRICEPGNRQPQATIPGHPARITALAFAPDETVLASASADGVIKLWNLTRTPRAPVPAPSGPH